MTLVMIATRFPFGGGVLHLIDASWALFFVLGRLYTPNKQWYLSFGWLFAVSWGIDFIATQGQVVSDYCMTPAYLGLPVAYGILAACGNLSWRRPHSVVWLVLMTLLGSTLAFYITNQFFYSLSGYFSAMSQIDYWRSVVQYVPGYILTTQLYLLGWVLLNRLMPLELSMRARLEQTQ